MSDTSTWASAAEDYLDHLGIHQPRHCIRTITSFFNPSHTTCINRLSLPLSTQVYVCQRQVGGAQGTLISLLR